MMFYLLSSLFVTLIPILNMTGVGSPSEMEKLDSFMEQLQLELGYLKDLWNYKCERSEVLCKIDDEIQTTARQLKDMKAQALKKARKLVAAGLRLSAKERDLRSLSIVVGLTGDRLDPNTAMRYLATSGRMGVGFNMGSDNDVMRRNYEYQDSADVDKRYSRVADGVEVGANNNQGRYGSYPSSQFDEVSPLDDSPWIMNDESPMPVVEQDLSNNVHLLPNRPLMSPSSTSNVSSSLNQRQCAESTPGMKVQSQELKLVIEDALAENSAGLDQREFENGMEYGEEEEEGSGYSSYSYSSLGGREGGGVWNGAGGVRAADVEKKALDSKEFEKIWSLSHSPTATVKMQSAAVVADGPVNTQNVTRSRPQSQGLSAEMKRYLAQFRS